MTKEDFVLHRMGEFGLSSTKQVASKVDASANSRIVEANLKKSPARSRFDETSPKSTGVRGWGRESDAASSFQRVDLESPHDQAGIPIMYTDNGAYIDCMDHHAIIIGQTGSGKSRCVLGPATLSVARSRESMLVIDPKGENLLWSSDALKKSGKEVKVLDLRDPSSGDGWNPLRVPFQLIHSKKESDRSVGVRMLRDFAASLIPMDGSDPYWPMTARDALTGLMWLLLTKVKKHSEANLLNVLNLCDMITTNNNQASQGLNEIEDPILKSSLSVIIENADTTRRCILAEIRAALAPFVGDADIIACLSEDDFNLPSAGKKDVAFFLILPEERSWLWPLASMFVKQLYVCLMDTAQASPSKRLPRRFNMLIDEFGNLAIDGMPGMITAARSRGIRFMLAVQSVDQLASRYGNEGKVIYSNCNDIVYLYSREIGFLEEFSHLIGNDSQGRRLIEPMDLMRLEHQEAIIISDRCPPFRVMMRDIGEFEGCNGDAYNPKLHKRSAPKVVDPSDILPPSSAYDLEKLLY